MSQPEIAVSVSTFERPGHLRRSLLSIAAQRNVQGRFEVVVTDDGSRNPTTRCLVEDFARQVDFPVHFTSHPHNGFQLSRCRNDGAAATTAPYLLFTDGDCLLPPDHLWHHLASRRTGWVVAGDCYRIGREASEQMTEAVVASGEFVRMIPRRERRRLAWKYCHAFLYQLLRRPVLPRLTGCNIGVWRSDYERVNGSDENYVGWGLEDRDLQLRLSRLGIRFKSILSRTAVCHLWHPPHETFSRNNVGTANLDYFNRPFVLTRCLAGLKKLTIDDLRIRVIDSTGVLADRSRVSRTPRARQADAPEVEILVMPGNGKFSGKADCQILLIRDHCSSASVAATEADFIVDCRRDGVQPATSSSPWDDLGAPLRKAA